MGSEVLIIGALHQGIHCRDPEESRINTQVYKQSHKKETQGYIEVRQACICSWNRIKRDLLIIDQNVYKRNMIYHIF